MNYTNGMSKETDTKYTQRTVFSPYTETSRTVSFLEVTRVSPFTGTSRTMQLRITPEQIERYERGEEPQEVFEGLVPWELKFFLTGITTEEQFLEVFQKYLDHNNLMLVPKL
jgi:hypothetical protein